jgi:tRNA pseudouridine13 synthase
MVDVREIERIGERKVGIEEYISDTQGIGGVLREEPDYFQVFEVAELPELNDDGNYLVIKVRKTNWDTINFARVLSNRLRISQKRIEYAGTKDKRAQTVQYYSIKNVDEELIERLESTNIKDCEIQVVGRTRRGLRLGDLKGNFFRIRVTDADADEEAVKAIQQELMEKGVPSYFGIQRFGTVRYITHIVGLHVLRRDYEEAFWTYVALPFEFEREEVKSIREELWGSRDARYGLRELPAYLRYERNLLQKLIEEKSEERALLSLPRTLKMMFVHAYQSYVFNRLLSYRIREFRSLKAVEKKDYVGFVSMENLSLDELNLDGRVAIPENDFTEAGEHWDRVNFLIDKNMAFLALPLPGYKTEVNPESWCHPVMMEILEEDGVSLQDFKHNYKEFSSSGEFRLAEIPINFEMFEFSAYNNTMDFSFFLSKGCYATSLLREFLKDS